MNVMGVAGAEAIHANHQYSGHAPAYLEDQTLKKLCSSYVPVVRNFRGFCVSCVTIFQ
jgi:hypothetical protein